MSTQVASSAPTTSSSSREADWSEFLPRKEVPLEDSMSPEDVERAWKAIYREARVSDEKGQREARAATYIYALCNGTTRVGSYSKMIEMRSGGKFPSAAIPAATGKMEIRRFFRGNMKESTLALRGADLSLLAPRLLAEAAEMSIGSKEAFATADWFKSNPYLTPGETNAYNIAFNVATERARRARDGRNLEAVEAKHIKDSLVAQGPLNAEGGHEGGFNF